MIPFINNVSQKCKASINAHFEKNPNDIIALSFGAFVLAFILIVTPHMPQDHSFDLANKPVMDQKINITEQVDQQNEGLNKTMLKASTLK